MNVYKKIFINIRLLILFAILVSVFTFGYRFFIVVGDSMNPSQDNFDIVLINKLSYDFSEPREGDVVVFWDFEEGDFLIKRVIGIPGDTIQIIEGYIYKNNELYLDEFSHINITEGITWEAERVGEGQYWVIGDNRDDTWFGLVWNDEIVGKLQ
jgi:signal peptidase I